MNTRLLAGSALVLCFWAGLATVRWNHDRVSDRSDAQPELVPPARTAAATVSADEVELAPPQRTEVSVAAVEATAESHHHTRLPESLQAARRLARARHMDVDVPDGLSHQQIDAIQKAFDLCRITDRTLQTARMRILQPLADRAVAAGDYREFPEPSTITDSRRRNRVSKAITDLYIAGLPDSIIVRDDGFVRIVTVPPGSNAALDQLTLEARTALTRFEDEVLSILALARRR